MKCKDCGHEYPSSLPRCRKCGRLSSKRSQSSTLIEFPRQPRVQAESTPAVQPAWRTELTEKVRAIRARRSVEQAVQEKIAIKAGRADEEFSRPSTDQNPLVAAALSRVRRATENATRAPQPQMALANQQPALALDKDATARALEPAIEPIESEVKTRPDASIEQVELEVKPRPNPYAKPQTAHAVPRNEVHPAPVELPSAEFPTPAQPAAISLRALDEIDPLDYLTAEVKKIDRALEQELTRDERAPIFSHLITGMTDVLTIAAGCFPFVALISLSNASFSERGTRFVVGVIVATISFFYLALTHCLCGKTFGMMLTNTRVVDSHSLKPANNRQAMLRAIGYFVAALPFGLGLLWALVDRRHRGWHDHLSHTVVTPDY